MLLFTYYGLRALSLFYLPFSFIDFYTMTLFAVFYGLDWFATVSPTVRHAHQHVRPRQGAAGLRLGVHLRTSSAARRRRSSPACCASTFDDYMSAFMLSGTLCLGAAIAALFIGGGRKAPERGQQRPWLRRL